MSDTLLVTSYHPSWAELAKRTCKTHADYAKKQGYDYHADCSDYQDMVHETGHRMGIRGFIKFDLMLHFLPKYQYVMWIDSDALVTNHDIRIEQYRSHGLTVGYDHNALHTTVMIAHSTPEVYDFLWACNNVGRRLFISHPWHEMQSVRYFSGTPPYDKLLTYYSVKELCGILAEEYVDAGQPLKVSGKYGWEPGDWILHLAALPLQRRIERAQEYGEKMGLL